MDVSFDALSSLPQNYDYLNNKAANASILAILAAIVIIYLILFSSLGGSESVTNASASDGRSGSSVFLEIILWSAFILLIIFNSLQYFFSINVTASLKNLFSGK